MRDRSNPFENLEELFERLNRQFETAARSWETEVDNRSQLDLSTGEAATSLDLADRGDEFVVTVDVPGYESDDLDSRLSGETLFVTGDREETVDDEADDYIRRERTSRSFSRQVRLPEPVAADDVDATVNNGVLTIRLPKLESSGDSHSIDIE